MGARLCGRAARACRPAPAMRGAAGASPRNAPAAARAWPVRRRTAAPTAGSRSRPIRASNGSRTKQVYIARGNAKATRGDITVYGRHADRPLPPSDASRRRRCRHVRRLDADERRRRSPRRRDTARRATTASTTSTTACCVLTGKDLELDTPQETRDRARQPRILGHRQMAVARGNAVAVRERQAHAAAIHWSADVQAAMRRVRLRDQHPSRRSAMSMVTNASDGRARRPGVYNARYRYRHADGHRLRSRRGREPARRRIRRREPQHRRQPMSMAARTATRARPA